MPTVTNMEDDFKAEIVAAAFLSKHADISKILIDRLGDLCRINTKDIYSITNTSGWRDAPDMLVLQSFRNGIYDYIPESINHPATLGGLGRTEEEILEEIVLQRKREQDARKFFKLFEQEASNVVILKALRELMYEQKGANDDLLYLFYEAWPALNKLPANTAICFVYVLPILHQVRGNKRWTGQCLSFLTGFPVAITEQYDCVNVDPQLASFTIGESSLGIDTNFSGKQYDGLAGWDIHVGPVDQERVDELLTKTDFMELLEILSGYFTPAALSLRFFIDTRKIADTMLSADRNTARLGYTFFL